MPNGKNTGSTICLSALNPLLSQIPRGCTTRLTAFILRKLEAEGLAPSAEADKQTLIRRLNFDLTGLLPTPAEVDQFLRDENPDAYESLVNRLLSKPQYGEQLAMYWLDLVRYADTSGYHADENVSVWPYRDYVIKAFNDNMPFDQFTIENLAGDLLPNATPATEGGFRL